MKWNIQVCNSCIFKDLDVPEAYVASILVLTFRMIYGLDNFLNEKLEGFSDLPSLRDLLEKMELANREAAFFGLPQENKIILNLMKIRPINTLDLLTKASIGPPLPSTEGDLFYSI